MTSFAEILRKQVMVCDGAMGTVLYERGIAFDHGFDEVNLNNPSLISGIHEEYIGAGADIIETNTFGGNRFRLKQHGLDQKLAEINRAGVTIARKAADEFSKKMNKAIFVAGSVGPLGKPIEPIGRIRETDAENYFREQVRILADSGADLIMLETFSDLHEVRIAIESARLETTLPLVVQMSFTEDGKTLMGNKPEEIAQTLDSYGIAALGANCSVGPQILLDVIEKMKNKYSGKFTVQPNAGLPRYVGGRYIYLASPDYFSDYTVLYMKSGASIIGGCCGTTPEHIRMIRGAVDRYRPGQQLNPILQAISVSDPEEPPEQEIREDDRVHSTLQEKLSAGKFVISVEVDPPRGMSYEKIINGVIQCKQNHVDAVNIADNPLAKAGMTPLAMASLIRESVQIEAMVHVSCRDRNILALQSELMSAFILGIRNVLCITGDPPVVGDYPDATGVFDIDSIGLIKMISNLNQGTDLAGKTIGTRTEFYKACAVNPTAIDLAKEYDRFQQKMDAGADLAMTQILYDLNALEQFAKQYKGRIPVMLGLLPLKNAKHANFMHNEIPDIIIPETIRRRMADAGEQGPRTGVEIAREFLKEARGMIDGIYIIPPFNNFNIALDVLSVL